MSVFMEEEYESYLKQNIKDITAYTYINEVNCFMGWFDSNYPQVEYYRISQAMIQEYINHEKLDGKENSTIDKKITILKSYFDFLWRNDHLAGFDPCAKIKHLRREESEVDNFCLSSKEIDIFLTELGALKEHLNPLMHQRNLALTTLYLRAGLRMREAIYLMREDVRIREETVIIAITAGRPRIVQISKDLAQPLLAYMNLMKPDGEEAYVFTTRTGAPIRPRTVQLVFENLTNRTGIHVNPRKLRNTYAVEQIRQGKNRDEVAADMGIEQLIIPDYVLNDIGS